MGGARCSYRNCTKKTDKKTHFFHYPVFDRVRCHQWITNAQKLDYLNLKLSQLKNRMVCEHHFIDDCFMNEMKQRLKNTAIPTEDGPFCTKTYWDEKNEAEGIKAIEMPINLDCIDDEFIPITEKKSHLSVKYGDFLTNDITEGINLTPSKTSLAKIEDKGIIFSRYHGQSPLSHYNQTLRNVKRKVIVTKVTRDNKAKNRENFESNQLPSAKVLPINFDEFNLTSSSKNEAKSSASISSAQQSTEQVTHIKASTAEPKPKKVQIISEKHISEPVKIPGELQLVSPSIVIQVPDKKKKSNIEVNGQEIKTLYIDDSQNFQQMKNEQDFNSVTYTHIPRLLELEQNDELYQPAINELRKDNLVIHDDSLRVDANLLEYIPSGTNYGTHKEQGAELSNIDMSGPNVEFVSGSLRGPSVFTLTDIPQVSTSEAEPYVDNNLSLVSQNASSNIDKEIMGADQEHSRVPVTRSMLKASKNTIPNKSTRHKMPPEKLAAIEKKRKYNMKLRDILSSCLNNMEEEPDLRKLTAAMKNEATTKKVGEHLYDKSDINSNQLNSQENIIAYFEARLQRMEDNLLNKIEQNSQKIIDVKKMLKNPVKKSSFTQTYYGNEATKKNLYQEMSQYLSPSTNSLIYEELFINQCLTKAEPKKRKRKYNNSDKEL